MGVFSSYATGAIAARLFSAFKSQAKGNARSYRKIVVIIVESSALYALSVLAALVTFLCGTNGVFPAMDAIVPLVVSLMPIFFRPLTLS
jgi:F0F1-type ATP synthase membrane subunit c/vacuolar-type H+-ATPase subunit K